MRTKKVKTAKSSKIARGPVAGFPPRLHRDFGGQAASDKALPAPFDGVGSPSTRTTPRVRSKSVEKKKLTTDVYDLKGKVVDKVELPKEIFGAKINNQLMAQAVRVYLANQRRGTVSTKTRGEVNKTTAKWYRQKGTGRARHGAKSAPIFVGGGVVFGPRPRDYSLRFPKKMKRASLVSALSGKLKAEEIKVVKGLEKISPKTKMAVSVLENLGFNTKEKSVLLVLPQKLENIKRASKNIKGVDIALVNQLNTYEVLRNKSLLFTKQAVDLISQDEKV